MSDAKPKILIAEIMARPEAVEKVRVSASRPRARTVRKRSSWQPCIYLPPGRGPPREVCRLRGLRRPGGSCRGAFVGTSRTRR